MTVAFNAIPGNLRVPLFYAEFNAGASPFAGYSRNVLIGHKLAGGSAPTGLLINLAGSDPRALFGNGSMLCDQAVHAREMDPVGEIWCLPVAEPSGDAATATVAFSGTATNAGTMARYIHGEVVSIAYAAGDTAATLAARFAAAVNAGYVKFNRMMLFAVSATASTGTVTLTARHAGTIGNTIRVQADLDRGFVDPAGVTITVSGGTLTGGTGEVDFAAALALLGTAPAEWISSPFRSASQLNAARDFLADTGSGRWAPLRQMHGHYTTVADDSLSNLTTLGGSRNDRHTSIVGLRNFPNAPWSIAAAINGAVSFSKNLARSITEAVEIARPLQTIVLRGIRAPAQSNDNWSVEDRQSLYVNGIGAVYVDASGQVRLDRTITTERLNAFSQPDTTFLDLETLAISAYVGRYMRNRVEQTFPRHVLKDTNPRNLQGVVTPKQARDVVIHAYNELCDIGGVCEGKEIFARNVIVERSADANRLNSFLPIDVANQLRVFAANITVSTQLAA